MAQLWLKSTTNEKLSLGSILGNLDARASKTLTLSPTALDAHRVALEKYRKAGKIEYTTDIDVDHAGDIAAKKQELVQALDEAKAKRSEQRSAERGELFRIERDKLALTSEVNPCIIPDMMLTVPGGSWLVTFEAVLTSPAAASGTVHLFLNGEQVPLATRPWTRGRDTSQVVMYMSALLRDVGEGGTIAAYWCATEGSMRVTTRCLTMLRVIC